MSHPEARPAPALNPVRPLSLVLIVHDHQPIGNFDSVFEQAYADAYQPFLAFLERHPRIRLALHTSGPLLQWIARHRRDYLARLRALVERNQVEPWGGGFFEPILPAIPEVDRKGQIQAMADWLELELGQRPRGLWLTERVWEPGLAATLSSAGVEYTAVDDAHFIAAGFEREQLWGFFQTEDQGLPLRVLPIHRELRYLVPFESPERMVAMLGRVAAERAHAIAVLGDDGEKFGVWPGTHKRCYEEGWIERWAEALEAHPWIELRTPSEAIADHAPAGLAYLPSASYHEMEEWSLPPVAQARYRRAVERLEGEFGERAHDLVRGGHWRNFLTRYPESNRIHKRMLRASRLLWKRAAEHDPSWSESRTRLWRAQCNCPYWHGVFGGLYLPHLRSAVYHELIAAEAYLAPEVPSAQCGDIDWDGAPDALLEGPGLAAWISARGARLWGLDDRVSLVGYGDTLSRRPEAYHERLRRAETSEASGSATIHGALRLKDASLAQGPGDYDTRGRDSFLDRWQEGGNVHDWALEPFVLEGAPGAQVVLVARAGHAPGLEKRFSIGADGALEASYVLTASRAREGRLAVDLNLGLHVPDAPDRWIEVDGRRAEPPHLGARASHSGVRHVAFVDGWAKRRLDVSISLPSTLERAPIETVSLSEGGVERVFQGVEARFSFEVSLEPGRPWRVVFRLKPGRERPALDEAP